MSLFLLPATTDNSFGTADTIGTVIGSVLGIVFWTTALICLCHIYRNRKRRALDLNRASHIQSASNTSQARTTQMVGSTSFIPKIIESREFSYPDDSVNVSQPEPVKPIVAHPVPSYGKVIAQPNRAPSTGPARTTQMVSSTPFTPKIIGTEDFSYPDDSINVSQPEPVKPIVAHPVPSYGKVIAQPNRAPSTGPARTTQMVSSTPFTPKIIGTEDFSYPDDSINVSQPEPVKPIVAHPVPSYGKVIAQPDKAPSTRPARTTQMVTSTPFTPKIIGTEEFSYPDDSVHV